jgi:hypothetical protein
MPIRRTAAGETREASRPDGKGRGGAAAIRSRDDEQFLEKYSDKLSAGTRRAKWISSPDEHADRKGQSLATRNPEVIRRWAEERNATPATATRGTDGRPRVLRFDFQGYGGANLEKIAWDEWLGTFQERNLVFLFQEQLKNGNQSNFFRLENPNREEG